MKIRTVALFAGGAAAFYLLRTPQGREQAQQLKAQAQRLMGRPDVQRNLDRAAQVAKDRSGSLGPVAGPAARFAADQVQNVVRDTPTNG